MLPGLDASIWKMLLRVLRCPVLTVALLAACAASHAVAGDTTCAGDTKHAIKQATFSLRVGKDLFGGLSQDQGVCAFVNERAAGRFARVEFLSEDIVMD